MNLDKKIISQIWDSCSKQIVDGYVYVKMDDLIKLEIQEISKENNPKMGMDHVATYLNNKGWIFDLSSKVPPTSVELYPYSTSSLLDLRVWPCSIA